MGFLQKLFSSGAGEVINSVGNVLDKVITTKGEKMQLQLEIDKAEQQFQIEMKNLSIEEQKAILGDIADARKRETDIQSNPNATKLSKNVSPYLALGGTLLTFGLFAWLMFGHNIDPSKKEIILYVLGVLSGILTQIFSYYFGSSQGSAMKSEQIQAMHNSMMDGK